MSIFGALLRRYSTVCGAFLRLAELRFGLPKLSGQVLMLGRHHRRLLIALFSELGLELIPLVQQCQF